MPRQKNHAEGDSFREPEKLQVSRKSQAVPTNNRKKKARVTRLASALVFSVAIPEVRAGQGASFYLEDLKSLVCVLSFLG